MRRECGGSCGHSHEILTKCQRNGLCTAAHTQLAEDPLYVRADSLLTDSELLRDLALGQSFSQQTKHFELALCQH